LKKQEISLIQLFEVHCIITRTLDNEENYKKFLSTIDKTPQVKLYNNLLNYKRRISKEE
jgi:hypothetical protein